ncbi:MAG: hypothetical protein COS88_01160 [Chloroflexi bacterium CG07_land_8_20_14_0_80_51_10]|nr:MAG: hypothetical protein COS88_01160 [Chloroflexi bacterium CG07_land_8_20_14_0_80_51_10]
MIKAVFFDLFNTLVHYDPLPEAHQGRACGECGIEVAKDDLRRGYWAANDFFTQENARLSVEKRSEKEKYALWIGYETTLLREAGVDVSRELVIQILEKLQQVKQKVVLFDDTLSTLTLLRSQGLTLGLISNLDRSLEQFCAEVGLTAHLDFVLTSHEVGFDKPHPQIFNAALERAQVQASEAIHVGDQYHSDVVGARGVGIKPLLLDRDGLFENYNDCQRIGSLAEVVEYL